PEGGRSGYGKPERGRSGGRPDARGTGGRGRPELRGGRGRSEGVRGRSSGPPGARAGGSGRGRPASGGNKRTSRNQDERNPTRSGIQYPSPRYRTRGAAPEPAPPKERPSLRRVRGTGQSGASVKGQKQRARKRTQTKRK